MVPSVMESPRLGTFVASTANPRCSDGAERASTRDEPARCVKDALAERATTDTAAIEVRLLTLCAHRRAATRRESIAREGSEHEEGVGVPARRPPEPTGTHGDIKR
jgi:hypothetical protein